MYSIIMCVYIRVSVCVCAFNVFDNNVYITSLELSRLHHTKIYICAHAQYNTCDIQANCGYGSNMNMAACISLHRCDMPAFT